MKMIHDLFSLKGRTAIVTGGGGVLCGHMAQALLSAGAEVFLLDINLAKAEKTAQTLGEFFSSKQVGALRCDVLDRASLEQVRDEILTRTGRIDILVNGAGGNHPDATTDLEKSFFDLPIDGFDRTFSLNFTGTLLPSQVFGRVMADQGQGCLINLSSLAGIAPLTCVPAYSAAKAAVANFTRWLATDLARNFSPAIRVNAIAPGFFHTEQNHFLLYEKGEGEERLTKRGNAILQATPQGRFGEGGDLAGATVWLASASFVTGTVVVVDGGFSAFPGV